MHQPANVQRGKDHVLCIADGARNLLYLVFLRSVIQVLLAFALNDLLWCAYVAIDEARIRANCLYK